MCDYYESTVIGQFNQLYISFTAGSQEKFMLQLWLEQTMMKFDACLTAECNYIEYTAANTVATQPGQQLQYKYKYYMGWLHGTFISSSCSKRADYMYIGE